MAIVSFDFIKKRIWQLLDPTPERSTRNSRSLDPSMSPQPKVSCILTPVSDMGIGKSIGLKNSHILLGKSRSQILKSKKKQVTRQFVILDGNP